jgi:hypothetical protein
VCFRVSLTLIPWMSYENYMRVMNVLIFTIAFIIFLIIFFCRWGRRNHQRFGITTWYGPHQCLWLCRLH